MPVIEAYPTATSVVGPATVYTADAGGDTTHTVDAALTEVDDYWNNRSITYLTGDNAGLTRLVTDFDDLTNTLTHEAFPSTCDAGDTYQLGAWISPSNAYTFNNSYSYSETDTAEQAYTGFPTDLHGNQEIDKVFVRIKHTSKTTTVNAGDAATATMTVRVYDGSTWQNYQVTKHVLAVTTLNDESLTDTIGDDSNCSLLIDVTSHVSSLSELASAQLRLLLAVTADPNVTVRWSVDAISLIICYHIVGGIFPTATAVTKRDLNTKEYRALQAINEFLTVTS